MQEFCTLRERFSFCPLPVVPVEASAMIDRTGPRAAVALLLLAPLGACSGSGVSLWPFGGTDAAVPAAGGPVTAVASNDPVVIFAAGAQPGTVSRITLANGQSANVRLVRSYFSANGRECREVLVSAGPAERNRVVCAAETGWTEARPLLRGGAGRP